MIHTAEDGTGDRHPPRKRWLEMWVSGSRHLGM